MTDQQVIDAMKMCLSAGCGRCPYKDAEWRKKGFGACRGFCELPIAVPWQLAHDLIEIAEKTPKRRVFHKRELNCRRQRSGGIAGSAKQEVMS